MPDDAGVGTLQIGGNATEVKTKKRVAVAVGCMAFLLTPGCVGGMELGDMPIGRGAALAAFCELVWAAAWWKAGWIKWRR